MVDLGLIFMNFLRLSTLLLLLLQLKIPTIWFILQIILLIILALLLMAFLNLGL